MASILSQREWRRLVREAGCEGVDLSFLDGMTNPDENDVPEGTPDDTVVISAAIIEELKARADWLWQEAQEEGESTAGSAVESLCQESEALVTLAYRLENCS